MKPTKQKLIQNTTIDIVMSLLWKKVKDLLFSQMKLQNTGYFLKKNGSSVQVKQFSTCLCMSLTLIIPIIMEVI